MGYFIVACIQLIIAVLVVVSRPLWKTAISVKQSVPEEARGARQRDTSFSGLIRTQGLLTVMVLFAMYCGMEYLCGYWGATFCVQYRGLTVDAGARASALFYFGITCGRLLAGFISIKLSNKALVSWGSVLLGTGILAALLIDGVEWALLAAFFVMGLGCAPMYPCYMHSAPQIFNPEIAPMVIGFQGGSGIVGGLGIPAIFGLAAGETRMWLFPIFMLVMFSVFILCSVSIWRGRERTQS